METIIYREEIYDFIVELEVDKSKTFTIPVLGKYTITRRTKNDMGR